MFIDTHAHLFFPNYNDDLPGVIERAKAEKVDYIIIPSTDLASAAGALSLADKYDFIYAAIGIHPHDTKEWTPELIPQIAELAKHKKVIAIGEIGLDYHYDFSPKEMQIEAFKAQLDLALSLDLPVIIHNREADNDMMEIMRDYSARGIRAQFHCYNGSLSDAKELIKLNHFISFTGNITFKKADYLRNILKGISPEDILLETDSPFMTPVPFRGKRNEPSYIKFIAEKIAEIYNLEVEELARITTGNVYKLFVIGKTNSISFTYKIRDSLYINVTNRCNAECVFCDRKREAVISGYNLKMNKSEEPPASKYIEQIGDPKHYKEIVFCGYGEPTIRWDVVKEIAAYVKKNGGSTRLNTNGHGSAINKQDITPELEGLIDIVSISLNTTDSQKYSEIMGLKPEYFYEMINFAKKAKQFVKKVVMTAVTLDEIDIPAVQKFAEEEIGVDFRARPYF